MNFLFLLLFWSLNYLVFSSRAAIAPFLPIIEDELVISHGGAGSIFSYVSAGYTISLFCPGYYPHALATSGPSVWVLRF